MAILFKRLIISCLVLSIISNPVISYAQELLLPAPGTIVENSPAYVPVIFKGLIVHPEDPLLFDFIVDTGNSGLKPRTNDDAAIRKESDRLVKYFLASLTISEQNQWVNLSPYEKDRILPEELGKTELGRDLLAQDYLLKQVTASLIHPAKELGHAFWARVYERARQEFGTTDIPVDTFNKVWITADRADVYVRNNTVFIVGSHLKVMLESDYLAAVKAQGELGSSVAEAGPADAAPGAMQGKMELTKQIVREIIIPELEKEVNAGKNFANLRQIFHSMILATWYKKNLKDSFLSQVYANKAKTGGVEGLWVDKKGADIDPGQIWSRYEQAYRTGVFNFIKEDVDRETGEAVPHRYFSGGMADLARADVVGDFAQKDVVPVGNAFRLTVAGQAVAADSAMKARERTERLAVAVGEINRAVEDLRNMPAPRRRTVALDAGVSVLISSYRGAKGYDLVFQFQQPWQAIQDNGQLLLIGYRTDQREENMRMWSGQGQRAVRFFSVPLRADFTVSLADAAMVTKSALLLPGPVKETLMTGAAAAQPVLQGIQAKLQEMSRSGRYQVEMVQKQGHVLFQFTDQEQAGTNFTVMVDKGFRLISMSAAGKDLFRVNPDLETLGGGIFSMFPFVNRLKEGKLVRNGRAIDVKALVAGLSMDGQTGNLIHGVARIAEIWKDLSVRMEGDAVVIQASLETTDYPGLAEAFGHSRLTKSFRLEGNTLTTEVEVENLTTAAEAERDGGYEVFADVGEHPFMVYTPGKTKLLMPGTTGVFAVDEQKIPTGEVAAVSGRQDFNTPQLMDHTLDNSFTVRADADGVVTAIVSDEERKVVTTMKMEGMFSSAPGEEAVVHAWGGNETSYRGIGAVEPVPVTANGPNRKGELGGSRPFTAPGEKRTGRVTMTVDAAMENEGKAEAAPAVRRTILLVDNHEGSLTVVRDIISDKNPGADIITANNGAEAIDILKKMSPEEISRLAAVYSDTQMPQTDGFGVAEYVARNLPAEVKYVAKSDDMTPEHESRYRSIFAEQPGRKVQIIDLLKGGIDILEKIDLIDRDAAMGNEGRVEAERGARKTVLLVDDDADLLETTKEMLAMRNPKAVILTAKSGAEAVALLKGMSPGDLSGLAAIYSDTQMPDMDGFGVAEYVAKNLPAEVKYIAKSGNMSKEFADRYKSIFAGQDGRMVEILTMPTDIRKLMAMELVSEDAAMRPPGGIDLNANSMTLNERGDALQFKFDPAAIEQFRQGDFRGIAPVILNITPIQSLIPLLGQVKEDINPSHV